MALNQDVDQLSKGNLVVRIDQNSESDLQALFEVVLQPDSTPTRPLQVPLRMRNLPDSFFNPPSTGSKSPSISHSRENSADSAFGTAVTATPNGSGGGALNGGTSRRRLGRPYRFASPRSQQPGLPPTDVRIGTASAATRAAAARASSPSSEAAQLRRHQHGRRPGPAAARMGAGAHPRGSDLLPQSPDTHYDMGGPAENGRSGERGRGSRRSREQQIQFARSAARRMGTGAHSRGRDLFHQSSDPHHLLVRPANPNTSPKNSGVWRDAATDLASTTNRWHSKQPGNSGMPAEAPSSIVAVGT